uniref:WD repeat-containing protein 44 n=1 Tax=Jaculus jaculus TaxID=51337 RepID=A0A8C5JY03_JACJA
MLPLKMYTQGANTTCEVGNESPVQKLKQDMPKKIIKSIIEESQKATANPSVAEMELRTIPVLLAIHPEIQENSTKSDSQSLPSDDTCEKSVDETTEMIEASSTKQFSVPEMETEVLNKEEEVKQGDVLDPASSNFSATKDFAAVEEGAPDTPPRHLTPEPDIVTSTKKTVPARPPPLTNFPPPITPLPSPPAPVPRKKKSELEFEALKTPDLDIAKENISSDCLLTTSMASESVIRDSQPSFDLASTTSGDKIVTAQKNGKAPDGQTIAGDVMGPQRPRSNSGRELTDEEILASVMIKNLGTGEEIPLSINPLTLHIMRRTKEYVSNDAAQSDDEEKLQSHPTDTDGGRLKQKMTQLKKFLGKSVKRAKQLAEEYGECAINKVKSVRGEVFHMDQDGPSSNDDERMLYTRPEKFKAAHGFKGPYDFDQIKVVQDLSGEHMGAVWTMKFSHCGRLLASAGQDNVVRIWALKNAFDYFNNMRMKYNTEGRISPSPSQKSLRLCSATEEDPDDKNAPFQQWPFCKYKGHTADLLDLSWSKNYFLLWHISRRECLCCFQHIDFVTLRLWNIPDKKVALCNEVDGQTKLITDVFSVIQNKYIFDLPECNNVGRKITGVEPLPKENKILVTSNDSRIRLYALRDLSLSMKYKDYVNSSSQINASFSHDFTYLVSGSEDKYVYIWSTYHDLSKFTSVRRDRNDFWESIKAHNAVVTSTIFAPNPSLMLSWDVQSEKPEGSDKTEDSEVLDTTRTGTVKTETTEVLLSADFSGAISVY